MAGIKIIQAGVSDSSIVGQLVYDLMAEIYADFIHDFPLDKMQKAAHQLLIENSRFWSLLAIDENNQVIAVANINECASIYAGGSFGEITELYVTPEFRSKKVGEQLMLQAKQFSQQKSWPFLEVGAPDVPRCQRTVDFYINNGFVEEGPRLSMPLK